MSALVQEAETTTRLGIYDVVNMAAGMSDLCHEKSTIAIYPSNCGVDVMVAKLRDRVRWQGRISVLRLHGPGGPGLQTISCAGLPGLNEIADLRSVIAIANFEHLRPCLQELKRHFTRDALVWLGGYQRGPRGEGNQLTQLLADIWGVPVTFCPLQKAAPILADSVAGMATTVTAAM